MSLTPGSKLGASRFHVSRSHLIALGILTLALAIRLWDLTARSLWLDEAVEYWVATTPLTQLPSVVRGVIQDPPLYSFLLHLWMKVAPAEWWLRLLSVFFGVGSVLGAMVAGYRLQGWTSALVGGLLMTVLPTAVRYSQEVGQYAPMQFFLAWSVVMLVSIVREPRRGAFVRWGVFAAAASWTYYGALVTVAVPFACVLVESVRQRDRARLRAGLWTLAAFMVAILPLLIYYLPHQMRRGPTERAFEPAAVTSLSKGLHDVATSLYTSIAFQFTGWPNTRVPGGLTVVLFAILVILAARRQRRFAVWLGASWLVYALLGWLHLFPFGFRYSIILTPLMVPLVACAFRRDDAHFVKAGAAVTLALVCVLGAISLPNRTIHERVFGEGRLDWPETEDVEKVTRYWAEQREPNQLTYVYYPAAPGFAYYLDRVLGEHMNRPGDWFLDCWRGDTTPACHDGNIFYGRWIRSLDPAAKVESMLATMGRRPEEFWIIIAHTQGREADDMGRVLLAEYTVEKQLRGRNAVAALVKRRVQ